MTLQKQLADILTFAHRAAWEAGKITLRYFQTAIATEFKADESPVTIADREAEHFLRTAITSTYPTHAIVGEEEGATGSSDADWRWILDPIDGTRAFVRGMPLYGVMVGLEYQGEPVLGVINMPALGEITYAASGLGCWWNGRPCRVSTVPRLHDGLLLATTADDRYSRTGREAIFRRLVARAGMFRTWGDCYGYVLVATGRAEATIDPIVSIWDVAAAYPIVREAGGTFTDWQGNATIHHEEGIGTNGLVFDEIRQLIDEG